MKIQDSCFIKIQHGCEALLEVLSTDMKVEAKAKLNKKAHGVMILCLSKKVLSYRRDNYNGDLDQVRYFGHDKVLGQQAVTEEEGVYVLHIEFKDEDLALLLLTSLPASYENFVDTLLYGREALTLEDDSHQSRENSRSKSQGGRLKCYIFKSEDHMREIVQRIIARNQQFTSKNDQPGSNGLVDDGFKVMMVMSTEALLDRFIDLGGSYHMTPKLDLFFQFLECDGASLLLGDNMECKMRGIGKYSCRAVLPWETTVISVPRIVLRDSCSTRASVFFVDYFWLDFVEALLDWIMDLGCSYHMTTMLDIFFDFIKCDRASVKLGDNRECKIRGIGKGTLEKEGYTIKLQSGKVKVIIGSGVILSGIRKDNCIYSLDGHAMAGAGKAGAVLQENSRLMGFFSGGIIKRLDDEPPKIATSRNVVFNESVMYKEALKDSGANDNSVEELQVEVELQRLNNHAFKEDQIDQEDVDDEDAGDQSTDQPSDLTDYQLQKKRWILLGRTSTWDLVDHPARKKLVSCKWLFKIKERIKGVQKPRFKARLVARRFTQRAGIDYNDVFSPVVQHTSIRVILALTTCKDYELEQLDVKTTFLHGNLEEVIYMRQPLGYEQGNKVCLLNKSLYGLKQSPRQWYKRFDEYMLSSRFKRSSYDSCVYYRNYAAGEYIYLLLYLNNMLIACKSMAEVGSTKSLLKKEFDMKELRKAKKILGIEIVRDRSLKMLLGGHFKLSLKDCPVRDCYAERMSKVPYANVVGSLMYLMVCTWAGIAYEGTANVGLVYGTNRGNHVNVTGFVDSGYAKDPDKVSTEMCCKLEGNAKTRGGSFNYRGEYMALTKAVKEAILLRGLLEEIGVELNTAVVNCDNQGAIHISRNHLFHENTKHINVSYHFIREVLEAKTVKVLKVGTKHNAADALTKVVPGLKLHHCLELLNVGVG
nr:retrovirus-related Pol polyprotein from transposon TNT 1-94 [Tanacetum cinerariifolium]